MSVMENQLLVERQLAALRAIRRLRRHIGSPDLICEIHRVVKEIMEAENVAVIFEDNNVDAYWIADEDTEARKLSASVVQKARESADGFYCMDLDVPESNSQLQYKIKHCCAARVERGSSKDDHGPIGVIYCDVRMGPRIYNEEDASFLKELADYLAIYMEHCALLRRTEQLAKRNAEHLDRQRSNPRIVLDRIVGRSSPILQIKKDIEIVARTSHVVLIQGESGTGKGDIAQVLHDLSDRSAKEYVDVDCTNLRTELTGSELFGHKKGAFTGAYEGRPGLVLTANHGTLFLDEIGDMPAEVQGQLLKVLQEGKIRPLGSEKYVSVDFRLICATNKSLEQMVEEKRFREDLFYRIAKFRIYIPPLRDRKEDLPFLAGHFGHPKRISMDAIGLLRTLSFPGNVRELKSLMELARDLYSETEEITQRDVASAYKRMSYSEPGSIANGTADKSAREVAGASDLAHVIQSGKLTLKALKELWGDKNITRTQLKGAFDILFSTCEGRVYPIGHMFGIKEGTTEMNELVAWVSQQRRRDVISKRIKFKQGAEYEEENGELEEQERAKVFDDLHL